MVMVPGHGITPALSTTPQSVLCDLGEQAEQLHVKGCFEKVTMVGVRLKAFSARIF